MKLRIHGNSVRLRLTRSEVARFAETGYISETLDFGSMGKFSYRVTATEDFTFRCIYDISGIGIKVPCNLAHEWASSDRVDMSGELPLDNGNTLHVTVEKDFQCIHKDSDFNSDAYLNPLAANAD